MDESQVLSILHGLTSGDSKTTQYMMNKYYTEDTVFEHAFYFMRGRKAVYSVWRGAFGLLLVEPHFIEYWAKVSLHQALVKCNQTHSWFSLRDEHVFTVIAFETYRKAEPQTASNPKPKPNNCIKPSQRKLQSHIVRSYG